MNFQCFFGPFLKWTGWPIGLWTALAYYGEGTWAVLGSARVHTWRKGENQGREKRRWPVRRRWCNHLPDPLRNWVGLDGIVASIYRFSSSSLGADWKVLSIYLVLTVLLLSVGDLPKLDPSSAHDLAWRVRAGRDWWWWWPCVGSCRSCACWGSLTRADAVRWGFVSPSSSLVVTMVKRISGTAASLSCLASIVFAFKQISLWVFCFLSF